MVPWSGDGTMGSRLNRSPYARGARSKSALRSTKRPGGELTPVSISYLISAMRRPVCWSRSVGILPSTPSGSLPAKARTDMRAGATARRAAARETAASIVWRLLYRGGGQLGLGLIQGALPQKRKPGVAAQPRDRDVVCRLAAAVVAAGRLACGVGDAVASRSPRLVALPCGKGWLALPGQG